MSTPSAPSSAGSVARDSGRPKTDVWVRQPNRIDRQMLHYLRVFPTAAWKQAGFPSYSVQAFLHEVMYTKPLSPQLAWSKMKNKRITKNNRVWRGDSLCL